MIKIGRVVTVGLIVGVSASACVAESVPASEVEGIGTSSDPVIGGRNESGYPAIVHVSIDGSGYYGTCTGTLIAPDTVLTAAHCMEDYAKNRESARISNQPIPNRSDASQWISVSNVEVHPTWWTQKFINEGHDCAILKLSRPLAGVTPIAVYRGERPTENLRVGKSTKIIGYGNNVGSPGSGAGTKRYADAAITDVYDGVIGSGRSGATSCQGDSGGGLLSTIDGQDQVIGVTSFGSPGCVGSGYFTNVSKTCLDLVRRYVPDGPVDPGTCTPSCGDRACGADGCGGSCGACATGATCSDAGQCVVVPVADCSETEPNDGYTQLNKLCVDGSFRGTTSGSNHDYVGFTVAAGRTYAVSFAARSKNATWSLYKANPTGGYSKLGEGPGAFSSSTSTGGSYVVVARSTDGAAATYDLTIRK